MRHVFLIGLSGSGKSIVGRILAQRLNMPLLDVDALIEEECGERIPAIFARHSEDYFRACEGRILARLARMEDGVIVSTGGGIVTRAENRTIMAERGVSVFLQVYPETALQRMQAQHVLTVAGGETPKLRPLLAGPDQLARLQPLHTTRSARHLEAQLTCEAHEKSAEQVSQEIIAYAY